MSRQSAVHYAIIITTRQVICQKDTFMIQHHVDMSQLNCCNCRDALIQTSHSNIWVSIRSNHAVLKVQLILITRHRELWTNISQTQSNLIGGISALQRTLTLKIKQHSFSAQLITVSDISDSKNIFTSSLS